MTDLPSNEPNARWMFATGTDGRTVPPFALAKWEWYRRASNKHRWRYVLTELVGILCAASVPAAVSMRLGSAVIAALGAAVVVVSGTRVLFGSHENWVEFSQTRYGIEREMAFYLGGIAPYDVDRDGVRLLIARIDDLTSSGGQRWAARRIAAAELPVISKEA